MSLVDLLKKFHSKQPLPYSTVPLTRWGGKITDAKGFGFNKAFDQIFHDSHVEEIEKFDLNKSN